MIDSLKAQIAECDALLVSAAVHRSRLLAQLVSTCTHPKGEIRKYWGGEHAPWLVCTVCGLAEEGWGTGYKKLAHAQHTSNGITFDEFKMYAKTRVPQPRGD